MKTLGILDILKERVEQFNSHTLPGQPVGSHMGTVYLVNDLWKEVQCLRTIIQNADCEHEWIPVGEQVIEDAVFCPHCHAIKNKDDQNG